MDLDKATTIGACERLLAELQVTKSSVQMRIPTNLRFQAAGGEAACVQLLLTWAQREQAPLLHTYVADQLDIDQVQKITRQLLGLVAALVADHTTDRSGRYITDMVKASALQRLEVLQSADSRTASRGAQMEIVCADHMSRGAPVLFYRTQQGGGAELRDRADFKSGVRSMLAAVLKDPFARPIEREGVDAIAGMLYEIFRNTEDHGMTDISGNRLKRSFRGVQVRHHKITNEQRRRIASDFEPLSAYLDKLTERYGSGYIPLVEVSVFDSGQGFAQSWTGRRLSEITPQEEVQAVRGCFSPGSRKLHSGFGQGLPHVARLLNDRRGFIRLRTGRQSFFFDFARLHHTGTEINLQTWCPAQIRTLPEVSGSLITLLVPVGAD